MATKNTLVESSTATSGSVGFKVGDAKSAAIRFYVKQGTVQAGSSGISDYKNGAFIVKSNPSSSFTLRVNDVSTTITPDPYVAATATFTFSSKPDEGSFIKLVDSKDVTWLFEIDDSANGTTEYAFAVTGITAAGGGAAGTATALTNKINSLNCNFTASNPSSGVVTLTQDTPGVVGNTSISVSNRSHWDSVCSVNVPTAFTGGTNGDILTTVASIETVLSGSNFSSIITATKGTSDGTSTRKDNNLIFIKSVVKGVSGNGIILRSSDISAVTAHDGSRAAFLSGGKSIFPSGGSTSTATVNVLGYILNPFEGEVDDLGSVISTGDPSMGRAATDGIIIFSDDQFTGSLQHFSKITIKWENLSAESDITIICSKI